MTISRDVLDIETAMQTILDTILDHHTTTLTAAWAGAWTSVRDDLEAALIVLAENGDVPGWRIAQSRRVQEGLEAAGTALTMLADQAGTVIADDAARALGLGVDGELAMIGAQLPPGHPSIVRVDPGQVAEMLQRTTEQITAVTAPISAETALVIRQELARGMIVGDNPREAARRMLAATEGRFTGGLTRALNISRTEMLDAMRTAQHATDQANPDTLAGWTWGAHLDSRTCGACVAMHGTEHPLEEPGPIDHHSGRCARIPRTKTWADLGFPGIEEPDTGLVDAGEWFDGLGGDEQRQILGKAGYEAWQSGAYPMSDWATRKSNTGWRDSIVPAKPPKGAS
ncbi:MAG: phage head morphogenesis protein [Brachybacterium sp.]|uniref:phage minor head protein n=1 Tax=Brachybacterium sp. TaxID=1891286 RepID=UPI002647FC61|nr:phage minor head protein [Brachybacterium sp.]MDN5687121.1 phage head morphogenesis protein [Brachybacterium sp.]